MIDLSDIERIVAVSKLLLSERKKYARTSERWTGDVSPKQAQKLNADLNWQAMAIIKLEAELHAACVDGGVADLREPESYADRELRPSGWHRYHWSPTKPKSLVA